MARTHCMFVVAAALIAAGPALAASPYAGLETRDIKAVAPERIDDLLAGRGAGYALSAELNGYPGPRHVLDLAEELGLTPVQIGRASALFDAMEAEAKALGAALVAQEHELESLFRHGAIDEATLATKTAEIGAIEARLRATHLKYHLRMSGLLDKTQRAAYDRLRGYAATAGDARDGHGHGHRHQH